MRRFRVLSLLFSALLIVPAARSATILAVVAPDSGGNNVFGTLDTTTGVFSSIATETPNIFGMGFAPNGTLFATDSVIPPDNMTPANVYTIDPVTGSLTLLGASTHAAIGSTVGPDGLIYALDQASNAAFFTINPTTLSAHVINSAIGFESDGLAVFSGGSFYTDSLNGGVASGNDLLEAVNPTTGVATSVGTGFGTATNPIQIFSGVNVNGTIFGASGDGNLYTIDPTTGLATLHVPITVPGVSGGFEVDALAFENAAPTVPEPASLGCVAIGLAFAALFRIRQRAR